MRGCTFIHTADRNDLCSFTFPTEKMLMSLSYGEQDGTQGANPRQENTQKKRGETTGKLTANGGDNRKPPAEPFTLKERALPSRGGGRLSAESGNAPRLLGVKGETGAPPQENTNTDCRLSVWGFLKVRQGRVPKRPRRLRQSIICSSPRPPERRLRP